MYLSHHSHRALKEINTLLQMLAGKIEHQPLDDSALDKIPKCPSRPAIAALEMQVCSALEWDLYLRHPLQPLYGWFLELGRDLSVGNEERYVSFIHS